MSANVCILSVIYQEAAWRATVDSIAHAGVPVFFVDRQGVGSLSKAFNDGFQKHWLERYQYVWMVSNVTFAPHVLPELVAKMEALPDYAAVHPSFDSDHKHMRQKPRSVEVIEAPFVEFTAPLMKASVFARFPLDEEMPYVGHDVDWGFRVREAGFKVGVYHGAKLGHTYIRHAARVEPVTAQRRARRQAAMRGTGDALARKHGPDWRKKLNYNGGI